MATKRNLYGLDRGQLEALFQELGLQAFRGRQIMKWAYHQGTIDFAAMTDLRFGMVMTADLTGRRPGVGLMAKTKGS